MRLLHAAVGLWLCAGVAFSQFPDTIQRIDGRPPQPGNSGPTAPPATGKGTISGTVINAKTHEPIRKATVMVNGAASLSAITDASGTFSFRSLPVGAYWVMANQSDFTARSGRGQMATNITLSDGEEKTGVELALQPGATIAGRVLDEEDRPIGNCSITARRLQVKGARPGYAGSVGGNSDTEGWYQIRGIMPGRYSVHAECRQTFPAPHGFMRPNDPEIPTEGYGPATFGGGSDTAASGLLADSGSVLDGIDFHLQRVRMFNVRVRVMGADGFGYPQAQVFMTSRDTARDEDIGMPGRGGHNGRFNFRGVTAGSYEVTAMLVSPEKALEAHQDIQVGGSQVTNVELKMVEAPSISGSVVADDPSIQLEGQQLSLQPLQQNYRGPFPTTTLGKDGTFEFKAVLPGHFTLMGMQGGFFKSVTLGGREVAPADFEISGESAAVMHISLSARFGKLQVNADSQPAAGVQLAAALFPVAGGQPFVNFFAGTGPVAIEFPAVAPGKYRVLLIAAENPWNIVNDPAAQKALEERMSEVTVAEATDQRVTVSVVGPDELGKILSSTE